MAINAPNSIDVTDYQFKLHDKLKLFNPTNEHRNNINLLATASTYGLIFVADPNKPELKVIQLNSLVELKEKGGNLPVRTIPLSNPANNIAVSSDNSLLAVNFTLNGSGFVTLYSVPTFLSANIVIKYNIRISPEENVVVNQMLWNPVLCTIFAVVLNNGALGVYNLKESGYEFHSVDKQEQAKCACWSPKGKQIVVGFPNGKLVQYKPDLKPAKTIAFPPNIHAGPFDTIAIQWLSTYQFAVVFLQQGEDVSPALYIINAPKTGNPTYINYDDICYSQCGPRKAQIFLSYIQQWNLLLMASGNSMELGMLGTTEIGETPTWCQYIPPDEARVELPLTSDKEYTYPIGFAFETGTTHQLTIGEQTIPVMPMIHLLSTHGMLISFNFLNLQSSAPGVCSPPQPIPDLTGLGHFKPIAEVQQTSQQQTQPKVETNSGFAFGQPPADISFALPSGATSTPAVVNKTKSMFGGSTEIGNTFGNLVMGQSPTSNSNFNSVNSASTAVGTIPANTTASNMNTGFNTQNLFSSQPAAQRNGFKQTVGIPAPQILPLGNKQPQPISFGQSLGGGINSELGKGITFGMPKETTTSAISSVQNLIQKPVDQTVQKPPEVTADKSKPLFIIPPTYTTTNHQQQQQQLKIEEKKSTPAALHDVDVNDVIRNMISTQIQSFELELQELSHRWKDINISIGTMDESDSSDKKLNELQELSDRAVESTESLASDIQSLRHSLNESFAMVVEAKSKLNMFQNPDLPQLATLSNVNQTNRRQLMKLRSMVATNEAQLQIVSQQIDAQWSNFQDLVRQNARTKVHIPSLEGVYQTLRKQKDILERERIKINYLKSKLGVKGILDQQKSSKSDRNVDSLADSILSMSLSEQVKTDNSRLSDEKLQMIRDVLRNRKLVKIKPQRPERVGLNSEVIQEVRIRTAAKQRDGAATKPEKMEKQRIKEDHRTIAKPTATKPTIPFNLGTNQIMNSQQQKLVESKPIPVVQKALVASRTSASQIFSSPVTVVTTPTPSAISKESSPFTPTSGFNFSKSFAKTTVNTVPPSTTIVFGGKSVFGNVQTEEKTVTLPTFAEFKTPQPLTEQKDTTSEQSKENVSQKIEVAPTPLSFRKLETEPKPALSFGLNTFNAPAFGMSKSSNNNTGKEQTQPELSDKKTSEQENVKPDTVENSKSEVSPFASLTFASPLSTDAVKGSIFGGFSLGDQNTNTGVTANPIVPTAAPLFSSLSLTTKKVETSPVVASTATSAATFSFSLAPKSEVDAATNSGNVLSFGVSNSATTTNVTTTTTGIVFGLPSSVPNIAVASTPSATSTFSFASFTKSSIPSSNDTSAATVPTITPSAPQITSTDSTDSLFGNLNICKPTAVSNAVSSTQPTMANVFGGSVFTSSAFTPSATSTETKSVFGTPPVTTTTTSVFANTMATTSSTSVPASANAVPTSTSIFGGIPKPDPSVFGGQSGSTTSPFGGPSITSSPFAMSSANQPAPGGNIFGPPSGTNIAFGMQTSTTIASGGSIFGGATASSTSNVFSGGTAGTNVGSSVFGPPKSEGSLFASPPQSPQTGGNLFARSAFGQTGQSTGSIFGGGTATSSAPNAFEPSVFSQPSPIAQTQQTSPFGGNPASGGFGQSIFGGATAFGQTTPFGSTSPGGSFVQGGPSIAQTGFGSPTPSVGGGFEKPAFGSPPAFGAAPGFGSPPAFGGTPTFGGAPSFGSPKSTFGSFQSGNVQPTGFAQPPQKNNLFESLGSSDSGISFGNLAQSTNNSAAKQQFGGSSFSSWR